MCLLHFVYPFVHQWTLGLFLPLAVVDSAAVNTGVQISLQHSAFSPLGYIPRRELLDQMLIFCLIFWGPAILFSLGTAQFYVPISSAREFRFLHMCTHTCYFPFFNRSHPNRCEAVSISSRFWFALPWRWMMLSIFACASWPSVYLLWRRVCPGPLPIWESGCFLLLSCRNASYSLDISSLSDTRFAGIFTHSMGVAFSLCLLCPLMYGSLFVYFDVVQFISCYFCLLCFWCHSQEIVAKSWCFSAMLSLRNSVVFALVFRPLIQIELIFVYGTGEGLTSFFSMGTSSFLKSICRRLLPPQHWMVLASLSKSFHTYW